MMTGTCSDLTTTLRNHSIKVGRLGLYVQVNPICLKNGRLDIYAFERYVIKLAKQWNLRLLDNRAHRLMMGRVMSAAMTQEKSGYIHFMVGDVCLSTK